MSASYCMGQALEIARFPREQWAERIQQLPDGCHHAACGAPRSCREKVAEYLRVQYRIQARKEAQARAAR